MGPLLLLPMGIAALIALLLILTFANYRISKSVLYPPFVFTFMWLLDFAVISLHVIELDEFHASSLLLFGFGAAVFSFGGAIAWLMPDLLTSTKIKIGDSLGHPRGGHLAKKIALVICFILMAALTRDTYHKGVTFSAQGSFLANARDASVSGVADDGASLPLLAYASGWTLSCAALSFIEKRDKYFWAMSLIALITSIMTTGRGPVIQLILCLVTIHLIKSKRLSIQQAFKAAKIPIAIFAALYIILTFTNKNTSTIEGGFIGVMQAYLVGYIVGPAAGMDYVLEHASDYANLPNATLQFPLKIGASLHLWSYTPPPFLDEFVHIPFLTNVYTGYKGFFTDYGYVGCLICIFIIGFLHTLLYKKAIIGSSLGLYLFSLMSMCPVMFIFMDTYSEIGPWLDAILVGCAYMIVRPLRLFPASDTTRFVLIKESEKQMLKNFWWPLWPKSAKFPKLVLFSDAEKKALGLYGKKFVLISKREKKATAAALRAAAREEPIPTKEPERVAVGD